MGLRCWLIAGMVFCFIPLAGASDTLIGEVLTWSDCIKEAARNHPDLISAKEAVVQQEASLSLAGSARLPQITANGQAASSWDSRSGSGNVFSYGLSGSQLLFDGFKTVNGVSSAREDVTAAKAGYQFTSAQVRYRLQSAFINLLKAQNELDLTAEIKKIRTDNFNLITLRYQSGMEHKGALLSSKAALSQALFDIEQARRGLENAQMALVKELGRSAFSPLKVQGNFDIGAGALDKPDLQQLAVNNPLVQKIQAQKRSAEFSLKADKGDFWPSVSLTGNLSRSDVHWMPEDQGSSAGVKLSWPLFEGGARLATIKRARSAYRQLEQQERSTRDGIVLGLEQAWNQFADAVGNVNVMKDFLTAAEERSKISEQQYAVGSITYNDWTIIEDSLVSSKKAFLDAQANALLTQAAWIQTKGETLEYEK